MDFRIYDARDYDGLVALWRNCGIIVSYNDPAAEIPLLLAQDNCCLYVAADGSDLIGSVLVGHDGYRGWIYKLAVASGHRKQGIGRDLVRLSERWIAARGLVKVNLMVRSGNSGAAGFYERLGYETADRVVLGRWLDGSQGMPPVDLSESQIDILVTTMEMTERPNRPTVAIPAGSHALMRVEHPSVPFYRFLYDSVGEPWFWAARRRMKSNELQLEIDHPQVELYVLYAGGQPAGYVELDRRPAPDIAIAYFGLIPAFIGRGLGKYLLNWAIDQAWSYAPRRLTVSTCSLDHPRAFGQYQQAGFRPVGQEHIQILDPRLEGLIPPHVQPRLLPSIVAVDIAETRNVAPLRPQR